MEDSVIELTNKAMDECSQVICSRQRLGSLDLANKELLDYAGQRGKLIEMKEV